MQLLFIGIAIGVLLAVPVAWLWSRRSAARLLTLEQRARTAERLAELGTMTSGLAHEIKNPLSTVGLNVQLLQEDLHAHRDRLPPEAFASMDRRFLALRRETQRVRETLEDFLRFAGRMELDRQPVSINALLDEVADFYEPDLTQQGVTLRRQLGATPDVADVDVNLLKQAVLNLLLNAAQVMANARDTDSPHGGARDLMLHTDRRKTRDGAYLDIHVTDTGPGIPPDHLDRIMHPYFSARPGGTGLGLPTTRRIVEEHGGRLTVHTTLGQGTDFVIELPATDA